MDFGIVVDWIRSLDIGELLIELAQFVFLFFAWKRKKGSANSGAIKSDEDLLALAEYHEKAAAKIRTEIKKKE